MTGTDTAWTGVVLAGGRSSRMGRDKALLPWRGRSLLQHMQALLREAGAARVVVSGDHPGDHDSVPDRIRDIGPLGGVASVAEVLPDGVLLLVPVDMPLLTPALLAALAAADGDCVCHDGYMLPMRLRLDNRLRSRLGQMPQWPSPARSLRGLHAAMGGIHLALPADGSGQLANCNTPGQWQELAR